MCPSKTTWSCPMWFYMHFTSIQRPRGHVPCGSTCILPLFKDHVVMSHVVLHAFYLFSKITWSCPMWFYMHFTSFQRPRGHVPCGSTCILPLFKDHVVMSHVVLHAFYLFSKTTWSRPMWFYMHFTSIHMVMSHVVLHAFYLYSHGHVRTRHAVIHVHTCIYTCTCTHIMAVGSKFLVVGPLKNIHTHCTMK